MRVPVGEGSEEVIYFADNKVLITQEFEDMECKFRKLLEEYNKWVWKISLEKKTSQMRCGAETRYNIER